MCVAMPGEVVDVKDGTASVSFGTIKKNIVTTLIPDLKIGDYVLVHAGFAITKSEKAEAEETLEIFKELLEVLEGEVNGA